MKSILLETFVSDIIDDGEMYRSKGRIEKKSRENQLSNDKLGNGMTRHEC